MAEYVGTSGNDFVDSNLYNDLYGLGGDDTIYTYAPGANFIDLGAGNNFGALVSTAVIGGTILGGSGNDFISAVNMSSSGSAYLDGGTGNDTLIGGGQADTIVGNGSDSMYGSTLTNATNQFYDLYFGNSTMIGGTNAFNYFHGSGGFDSITGGDSGDYYWLTQSGSDTVNAGGGADYVYDTSYSNALKLGGGNDTVYAVGANNDTITGTTGNKLIFFGDTSSSSATQVTGGSGNDTINGAAGQGIEYMSPGTGSGVNEVTGDDYSNHIYGNNNTGTLYMRGGLGQDEMVGGHGSNTFIGGGGGDFATGGGASNAFVFNSAGEGDLHISNFNTATDVIGIYAGGFGGLTGGETLTAGFNLLNGTTTAVAKTATFEVSGGALYFDPDGTGSTGATMLASLGTSNPLTPNNFRISATKY